MPLLIHLQSIWDLVDSGSLLDSPGAGHDCEVRSCYGGKVESNVEQGLEGQFSPGVMKDSSLC